MLLSAASMLNCRLFSHDVTQAYLQSKENLSRCICIKKKPEYMATLGLQVGELLELHRPLYGLFNAGDYWSATMDLHFVSDLGMNATAGDLSLFLQKKDG